MFSHFFLLLTLMPAEGKRVQQDIIDNGETLKEIKEQPKQIAPVVTEADCKSVPGGVKRTYKPGQTIDPTRPCECRSKNQKLYGDNNECSGKRISRNFHPVLQSLTGCECMTPPKEIEEVEGTLDAQKEVAVETEDELDAIGKSWNVDDQGPLVLRLDAIGKSWNVDDQGPAPAVEEAQCSSVYLGVLRTWKRGQTIDSTRPCECRNKNMKLYGDNKECLGESRNFHPDRRVQNLAGCECMPLAKIEDKWTAKVQKLESILGTLPDDLLEKLEKQQYSQLQEQIEQLLQQQNSSSESSARPMPGGLPPACEPQWTACTGDDTCKSISIGNIGPRDNQVCNRNALCWAIMQCARDNMNALNAMNATP